MAETCGIGYSPSATTRCERPKGHRDDSENVYRDPDGAHHGGGITWTNKWVAQESSGSEPVRCDYCGDLLPAVKSRAHIPTTPDLQRRGFAADKVVCPACVTKQQSGDL